jgi:hypothetical protein
MSSTGANYTTAQVKARGDLKVHGPRMLTYAHVYSRMLTNAHVCSRMLTGESPRRPQRVLTL